MFLNHYCVEDIEILLRRSKGKEQEITSQLERSFSLSQEEFLSFQDFDLDPNLEQSLLKSKFGSDLNKFVVYQKIFHTYLLDSI